MKLVLIFERRHVYSYDYNMWGIQYFEKKFSDIEFWSFVDWTFDNPSFPLNGIKGQNIYYLSSIEELHENLNRVRAEKVYFLIYPYHAYSYKSYLIRKNIKKYGFHFSNLTESPTIDNVFDKKNLLSISIHIVILLFKTSLLYFGGLFFRNNELLNKSKIYFFGLFGCFLAKSDYNFITTPLLFYSFPNYFEKYSKRNVLLHSESYEEFLSLNKISVACKKQKYAVFIDQFSAGHSDFFKLKIKPDITDSKKYYKDLCRLFNKIESMYSYNVIIAAHPKAEYKGDEFENREIVFFKTPELIKYSSLVIIQNSTSFGLSCLCNKDFLHIYSKEMFENRPINRKVYEEIDKYFQSKSLDISNNDELNNISSYIVHYSKEKYNKFIELLVCSSKSISKTCSEFEVISDYIFNKSLQLNGNNKK